MSCEGRCWRTWPNCTEICRPRLGRPRRLWQRPALIVIDLATFWTRPQQRIGANLESIIDGLLQMLAAARAAKIPIFFTTYAFDPADPPSPQNRKLHMRLQARRRTAVRAGSAAGAPADGEARQEALRLGLQGHEPARDAGLAVHRYADRHRRQHQPLRLCHLPRRHRQLPRDRPARSVGERCELFHDVSLLDIDIDLADVMPLAEVVVQLQKVSRGG